VENLPDRGKLVLEFFISFFKNMIKSDLDASVYSISISNLLFDTLRLWDVDIENDELIKRFKREVQDFEFKLLEKLSDEEKFKACLRICKISAYFGWEYKEWIEMAEKLIKNDEMRKSFEKVKEALNSVNC